MARPARGCPRSLIGGWHDPRHSMARGTVAVLASGWQALQAMRSTMNVAGEAEHPLHVGTAGVLSIEVGEPTGNAVTGAFPLRQRKCDLGAPQLGPVRSRAALTLGNAQIT